MVTLEQIKTKVQIVIKESGMSQSELARKLGVKPQTVFNYLNGKILPALDTFANLCKILDVDPAEVLCIKD